MIRTVVLPYGRAGMIGASMLGLGRALGETIVVSFILTPVYVFNYHVLEAGGNSVTYMIANFVQQAGSEGISALFAAGLVLVRGYARDQHDRGGHHQPVPIRRDRLGGLTPW